MPPLAPVANAPVANGTDDAPADDPPIGFDIDVVHEDGDWAAVAGADALVRSAAAALAAELASIGGEVCIALSSDALVAELNGSYRGKPAPTNVLSFPATPMLPVEGEPRFLGDIVLALETMRREAADLNLPVEHHMQHLVVHGILHLLGYDHESDEQAQDMESLEIRVLARLGVADPYAAASEPIDH
jgi:probable rRNA maturation factor